MIGKRQRLLRIVSMALLLAALLAAILPATAQGIIQVRTTHNLHLRAAATTASRILATAPADTVLYATAVSPNYRWLFVNYAGINGWMARAYLAVEIGDVGSLPISTAGIPPAVTEGYRPLGEVIVQAIYNVNMRMEPDPDAELITYIPAGRQGSARAVTPDRLWVFVEYRGLRGWVAGRYLDVVSGSLAGLPGFGPVGGEPSISYSVDRTVIAPGDCVIVSWAVQGAREVRYRGGVVAPTGSQAECPTETRSFLLHVDTTDGQTLERRVDVTVSTTGATPVPGTTGRVEITLQWSNAADMDLSVIEPSGVLIDQVNRNSASGGQLDMDANFPCGTNVTSRERITWAANAPTGTYTVIVNQFNDCGAGNASWSLTATVDGQTVLSQSGLGGRQVFTFTR